MQHNRDVGSAVLEAYSRVLEQRLASLRDMSLQVLVAAGRAPAGLSGVLKDSRFMKEVADWLKQLELDVEYMSQAEMEEQAEGSERPRVASEGGGTEQHHHDEPSDRLLHKRT